MSRAFVLVVTSLGLMLALPSTVGAGRAGTIVLGKKSLLSGGVGWGTARPTVIFNGGDPNGRAWNLRWSDWGSSTASGQGLTWIFRPEGGYFSKPGRIELRASKVGRCTANGPSAYTKLEARESLRPGGPFGRWFVWGGWSSICHGP